MKLSDLKAKLAWKLEPSGSFDTDCPSVAEAQGILFVCPLCYVKNGGIVGTHSVLCWFKDRGVPDDLDPKPGRWIPTGNTIDDITFVGPGAASVLLTGGCGWHGYIKNGDAT